VPVLPSPAGGRGAGGEGANDLHSTQSTFGAALLSSQQADQAAPLFQQAHDTALDRLAIYRGNVVTAASKALQGAYPVIEQIVGAEFFAALARAYWQAHPSTSGDLHDYGGTFAAFVATFEHTQHLPYLPDVAQLEWAVQGAYGAADHVPLAVQALAEIAPEALDDLYFGLQAGAALLSSRYPIASIWQQHQADYTAELDINLDCAEAALVHRRGDRVQVTSLTSGQYELLRHLHQGMDLQNAVTATLERHPNCAVDQTLVLAFREELIISLRRENHAIE
jgi:uncharacterized protein